MKIVLKQPLANSTVSVCLAVLQGGVKLLWSPLKCKEFLKIGSLEGLSIGLLWRDTFCHWCVRAGRKNMHFSFKYKLLTLFALLLGRTPFYSAAVKRGCLPLTLLLMGDNTRCNLKLVLYIWHHRNIISTARKVGVVQWDSAVAASPQHGSVNPSPGLGWGFWITRGWFFLFAIWSEALGNALGVGVTSPVLSTDGMGRAVVAGAC